MKSSLNIVALTVLFFAGTTHTLQVQRSGTQGFNIGVALNGSSIQLDDADFGDTERENGAGIGAHAAYNFTENLGAFISVAGAQMNDDDDGYVLGQADLGVRYTFANPASALIPYIEAAYTGLSAQDEFDGEEIELQGNGFTGAAGLNYFLSPALALDANFRYTSGEFDTIKIGDQSVSDEDGIGVKTGRFNVGLSWYPQGG